MLALVCAMILTTHAAINSSQSPYHGNRVGLVERDKASHITTIGRGCQMLGVDGSKWR